MKQSERENVSEESQNGKILNQGLYKGMKISVLRHGQ
jgi:hypothetical protein